MLQKTLGVPWPPIKGANVTNHERGTRGTQDIHLQRESCPANFDESARQKEPDLTHRPDTAKTATASCSDLLSPSLSFLSSLLLRFLSVSFFLSLPFAFAFPSPSLPSFSSFFLHLFYSPSSLRQVLTICSVGNALAAGGNSL